MAKSGFWVLSGTDNDKIWRDWGCLEGQGWLPRCLEQGLIHWMVKKAFLLSMTGILNLGSKSCESFRDLAQHIYFYLFLNQSSVLVWDNFSSKERMHSQ